MTSRARAGAQPESRGEVEAREGLDGAGAVEPAEPKPSPDLEAEADAAAAVFLGAAVAEQGQVLSPSSQSVLYQEGPAEENGNPELTEAIGTARETVDNAQLLSQVVSEQQGGGAAGLARPVMGAATARGLNEDLARYLAKLEQQGTVELAKLAQAMAFVEAQRAKSFDLGWLDISLKLGQLERDVRAHTKMAQESLQKQQAALGEAAKNTKSSTDEANEAAEGCASAACVRSELLLAFESESQSLATTLASLNLGSALESMKLDAFLRAWGLAGDAAASPEQAQEHAQAGEINELVGQRWTQATQACLGMASEVERFPSSVQKACMPAMLASYDELSAKLLSLREQYLGNPQSEVGVLKDALEAEVSGVGGWLGRWKREHSEVFETSLSEETEKASEEVAQGFAPFEKQEAVHAAQQAWLARLDVAWEVEKEAVLNWVTGQQSKRAEEGLSQAKDSKDVTKLPEAAGGMQGVEKLLMLGAAEAKAASSRCVRR